ncbi:MAG: UDP-glucose/GDP-mannose dehydrogenase family protein [Actinomycetota bacterium]|nr:UDP-glucose/GDP-mannose dehydrogenase family protein [Actinomycetota bacterium]
MGERIAVIGCGYVGSVAAGCLASIGHEVVGVERDAARLALLRSSVAPVHEPGLTELLAAGVESGRLRLTDDPAAALEFADAVFLCVGTPPGPDGRPEMGAMSDAARTIAAHLRPGHVVVTKSTVPIGTGEWLAGEVRAELARRSRDGVPVVVVSNPEFLREGSAVEDFLHPDRVVLGGNDPGAVERVAAIYEPILAGRPGEGRVPLVRTGLSTAEMTKYASNAFLATKIGFANEMSRLCDLFGTDVATVMDAVGLDRRIGGAFLEAGIGWGGSCLGKDLAALVGSARDRGYEPRLLEAAVGVNEAQRQQVVDSLAGLLAPLAHRRVAVLGLAFKPGTDDVRDSPGLDVAKRLVLLGARVVAFDPMVREADPRWGLELAGDVTSAVRGAHAVVVATAWPEFASLDAGELLRSMGGDVLFDGRNVFDPVAMRAAGFRYVSPGRAAVGDAPGAPGPFAGAFGLAAAHEH